MTVHPLDIIIIVFFFLLTLSVGWFTMRRAGKDASEFFLSGRSMPWWLLGFSLVATTFAADTPNLVTGLVRKDGVCGNWCWWGFLPAGMTTVFIYARLWRRLGVMTDLEFYEIRYSGKSAAFLRGFRTLYLGLIVNTLIMATVTLAIIKILNVMLGLSPLTTVLFAGSVTVIFATSGGFSAVLWADFILFLVAMVGSISAAVIILMHPNVGGLTGLITHPNVMDKLSVLPDFSNTHLVISMLIIPLALQWWSTWYPGAEPGGGSYTAQRMLAAKNESHAVGATLFFNFCHYAVRPWPWILVALASLIIFPDLESLHEKFPTLPANLVKDDMAYPAMMTLLPPGFFGLVVASLFAAYMSTIATHLNLGSSYMVNDFYHRFINPNASEKQLVRIGRISTVILMILASVLAPFLESATDAFDILLMVGAGTGLLFLLRWFWWRINAWSEIVSMCVCFPTALYFKVIHVPLWTYLMPVMGNSGEPQIPDALNFSFGLQLLLTVVITTLGWLAATYLTSSSDLETLCKFASRTQAGGPGWRHVYRQAASNNIMIPGSDAPWPVPLGILASFLGCVSIYAALFSTGALLYGQYKMAILLGCTAVIGAVLIYQTWRMMSHQTKNEAEQGLNDLK